MPEATDNSEEANLAEQAPALVEPLAQEPAPPEPTSTDAPETPQEQAPMIDVHPPHHAVTTWRDFFIHMATIVLGLLIAIGLEQSVEALHHLHQRHELERDLRLETEKNLSIFQLDSQFYDAQRAELVARRNYVEALRANPRQNQNSGSKFPPPPNFLWLPLQTATWETAEASSSAALLPREEGAMFHDLNRQYGVADRLFDEYRIIAATQRRFEERFANPASPNSPPTDRMNPDELKQYSGLISDSIDALQDTRLVFEFTKGLAEAVESGARSIEEAQHYATQHAGIANAPTAAPKAAN